MLYWQETEILGKNDAWSLKKDMLHATFVVCGLSERIDLHLSGIHSIEQIVEVLDLSCSLDSQVCK